MLEREGDRQLQWVQQNCDRPVSRRMPVTAGEVARQLVTADRLAAGGWRSAVAAVLEECLGAQALLVEPARISRGTLTLLTADAGRACVLRMQWAAALAEHFLRRLPESGIRRVVFKPRAGGRKTTLEG